LLVNKPKLAIDIGGNVGDYSMEMRNRNPDLEIHIFEPDQTNLTILRNRFIEDRLITVVPSAISNNSGNAILYADTPGSVLASLTKRNLKHLDINFEAKQQVATIRFEDYWKNALSSRLLDIVKIDIEGHELDALEGFGSAIESVKVLQFEFGGCNIDTRTFFQDFWYFFKKHQFDIFRITPNGMESISRYREVDEFFSTTNYIAKNSRIND
jgi:FkbM family methyltransferase